MEKFGPRDQMLQELRRCRSRPTRKVTALATPRAERAHEAPRPSVPLRASLRPVALASVAVAALFVGGFSAWGFYAPLASAAIAPGVVSPDSSRKTIQHLEGGIVQEILVTEGDRVEKGDLLMRLSPVQAQASFSARQRQWRRFEAERLRLQALEGDADLVVSAELTYAHRSRLPGVPRQPAGPVRRAAPGPVRAPGDPRPAHRPSSTRKWPRSSARTRACANSSTSSPRRSPTRPSCWSRTSSASPSFWRCAPRARSSRPDRLQRGHNRAGRPEGRGDRAADPVAEDRLSGFSWPRTWCGSTASWPSWKRP
jgi:hypothetical protein